MSRELRKSWFLSCDITCPKLKTLLRFRLSWTEWQALFDLFFFFFFWKIDTKRVASLDLFMWIVITYIILLRLLNSFLKLNFRWLIWLLTCFAQFYGINLSCESRVLLCRRENPLQNRRLVFGYKFQLAFFLHLILHYIGINGLPFAFTWLFLDFMLASLICSSWDYERFFIYRRLLFLFYFSWQDFHFSWHSCAISSFQL